MTEPFSTDIYESFNLYVQAEKFFLEPRDREGGLLSTNYLEIDRHSNAITLKDSREERIPFIDADIKFIYGYALVVIKRARIVGQINGHNVWLVTETDIIPYKKATLHLTDKQTWYNRHFTEMLGYVLSGGGFYYSHTLDLSRSLQWLSENATPACRMASMIDRASDRFVWNKHLLTPFRSIPGAARFSLPIIHGFFGQIHLHVNNHSFKLALISRRSVFRAGVRFYKRGVDANGHPANFVETEQIVETEIKGDRRITAHVQCRGSIPLFWSQKPNLRWQPIPTMKPTDDQLLAFKRHFEQQRACYGGKHVIVSLVNTKGNEKRVGGELERVSMQANLPYVRLHWFDFHKECHAMQWHRLSILRDQLQNEITEFGFFASSINDPEFCRAQAGFFRTNCMDCLDRTNVVQSLLARESLSEQLQYLGILRHEQRVEHIDELEKCFKFLWADNGDECSKQYAGTGALKSDYTRLGRRTYMGAMNDGVNAVTRYFRNNFGDGYRQDSIDYFLGNFVVDPSNLPPSLEASLIGLDQNGMALIAALFAMAMTVLCVLVAENITATLFWLSVFFICIAFIFINGEEFVNAPKLKKD
ncbi:hypothetical protein WR25_23388 [Diploscapter pachys]|uniref:Phosphatidylinositol-3-phosphatase SAC1 n=1 Tax=Diploscapter pachys TaxID=2018661 RepID=A0A2A2J4I9_9BILA|nr:hypothetical protein WR25_23388 [Diploscapter pachys]